MRLYEKPNGIEELTELREFMKQVPDTLTQLQLKINRALADWSVFKGENNKKMRGRGMMHVLSIKTKKK